MTSRSDSAAATRRALLDVTAELLDEGGPDAVTLRAVGARAGVSRGAPYGHFADKDELLTAVAIASWQRLAVQLAALRADAELAPHQRLTSALLAMLEIARSHPHLHALMFRVPKGDPAALATAALTSQDEFLPMVAAVAGEHRARPLGALLLSGTLGVAGMERAGQLETEKWQVTGDELVALLTDLVRTSGGAVTSGAVLPSSVALG
ncbi:MAG: TetR/AcrR family transcriptional regulator [Propionicimonas sp.]|uniref:TetR/AcrR family transcriptional regulator n=1 Tax=Propionicimonas sp. TaxID=1955623 RepID=UPI003D09D9D9